MLNHDNNENQQTELELKTMMRTTLLNTYRRLLNVKRPSIREFC